MDILEQGKTYIFNYTGNQQIAHIPYLCILKFKCWGGNGGNDGYRGGYGGYAEGKYTLLKPNTNLYIHVGGNGASAVAGKGGGYNGGGNAGPSGNSGAGGGASHIAFVPGLLQTLEGQKKNILIVAAGAGGGGYSYGSKIGRNGGGLIGQSGDGCTGGSQIAGGSGKAAGTFGKGGNKTGDGGGGGAGFYGGGASSEDGGGAGGSSYIAPLYEASTSMSSVYVTPRVEITLVKFLLFYLFKTSQAIYTYDKNDFIKL